MTLLDIAKNVRRRFRERKQARLFHKQGTTTFQSGKFTIEAPDGHATIKFAARQPYRDLCIGISAKYAGRKYKDGAIVDIGANIGDTAAIVASHAKNKLTLVEPSDFFFEYLEKNSKIFPNDVVLVKSFIGDGTTETGELKHWGGTAYIDTSSKGQQRTISTRRLQDIAGDKVAMIKIDTDGFDFKIIDDSLSYLQRACPPLFFENSIRSDSELEQADDIFHKLMEIGYSQFIVWDDPGFLITSTRSLDTLRDLNRYLRKIWSFEQTTKSISNYDVFCLKSDDEDIFRSVCNYYANN